MLEKNCKYQLERQHASLELYQGTRPAGRDRYEKEVDLEWTSWINPTTASRSRLLGAFLRVPGRGRAKNARKRSLDKDSSDAELDCTVREDSRSSGNIAVSSVAYDITKNRNIFCNFIILFIVQINLDLTSVCVIFSGRCNCIASSAIVIRCCRMSSVVVTRVYFAKTTANGIRRFLLQSS